MKKTILLLLILSTLASCRIGIVEDQSVYRSDQLKPAELQKLIEKANIKTIINLRGENPQEKWFQDEVEVAEKNGVSMINISMSAGSIPHRSNLLKLLDALRDAPKPILIHCMGGADRTGEASALYQMIYMNISKADSLKMLTPTWGHIEKLKPAKIYFVKELWQGEDWARNEYYPCRGNYKFYDKNNSECQSDRMPVEKLSVEEDS